LKFNQIIFKISKKKNKTKNNNQNKNKNKNKIKLFSITWKIKQLKII